MNGFTHAQVHAFRLKRHHLERPAQPGKIRDVVSDTCGIQAQVMSAAQLALRVRSLGLSVAAIERALWQDRDLVKVWCMRGTLHVLPAHELPVYVAALKPYRLTQEQRWMARYGVDTAAIQAMTEAILAALGEIPLTRRQLSQKLNAGLRKHAPQVMELVEHGWGGLGKYVCLQGDLCLGPNQGQEATFVRRDMWLSNWEHVPGEEAEVLLLKRYLQAYGPATVQDFSFWAGMPVKDASRIWRRLQSEMQDVTVAERTASILKSDLPTLQETKSAAEAVRLLPHFDVYLLAHRSKTHLVEDGIYKRVFRAAGWISPVVLVNGRVAGVWSHARRGEVLQATIELFDKLSRPQYAAIEQRAADVARFFDSSLELAYTSTAGAIPAN